MPAPRPSRALARAAVRVAIVAGAAVVLALASSAFPRTRLEVQDWDCPPPPASCARPVQVRGFPLPYISDYHGLSVVGRANLLGALMGEDLFHAGAFWANVACWGAALGAGWAAAARLARRRRR